MQIRICPEAFDPWHVLAEYQDQLHPGSYGATAVFVGTMRDFNQSDTILSMTLEYYAQMTEKILQEMAEHAVSQHRLLDVLIYHRVGVVCPNDPIVLVAAWSAHRKQALLACREIMEFLKARAPFWKKEQTRGGQRWVEQNTPG